MEAAICILGVWQINIYRVYMYLHITFNRLIYLFMHPKLYGHDNNGYFVIYHYHCFWYILTLNHIKIVLTCNESRSSAMNWLLMSFLQSSLIICVFFNEFLFIISYFSLHITLHCCSFSGLRINKSFCKRSWRMWEHTHLIDSDWQVKTDRCF